MNNKYIIDLSFKNRQGATLDDLLRQNLVYAIRLTASLLNTLADGHHVLGNAGLAKKSPTNGTSHRHD